jgi:hypothetical protein
MKGGRKESGGRNNGRKVGKEGRKEGKKTTCWDNP